MSRSNGPGVPPNGWPADYPPSNPQNPYTNPYPQQPSQAAPPSGRPPRIQNPAPARSPQSGFPPQGQAAGVPQERPGYGQPNQPQYGQPQQQPAYYPQPGYGQPPAQPQYGAPQYGQPPAAPPNRPAQPGYPADPRDRRPSPYDALNGPATGPPQQSVPQTYVPPPQYPQTQPPQQQRGGYDQWQQHAPSVDPHGYDLGTYMPAPVQAAEPRTQRPTAPPAAPPLAWNPGPQPQGYASEPPISPSFQVDSNAHQDTGAEADEYEYEDEAEFDEAPRRARYGLIAASLIGAIAAGGGLAYAYKAYISPPSQTASAPLVRSGSEPVKVKPADPGGTKFANTESKLMDSLSGSQPEGPDDGPRMVRTLKVERDGSITPAGAAPAPVAAPAVPGMILVGGAQPTPAPAAAPPPAMQQPVAVAPPPPPAARPVVIAAAPPPAAASADEMPVPVAAPPAKKPVKKAAPPSAVGGPPAGATSGYVAVLASVPASGTSRLEAMQQFADLQQKVGGVLGNKAPDVVEAKLDKGTYHRLVVGPPASRDAATSVCSQLKAAGYTADCWVTAF